MHLVADYTHPYGKGLRFLRSQCRIRIYSPDDPQDAPVVICSELASNLGTSVTETAQSVAGEVIEHHHLRRPVWIEHYPTEATNGRDETFDLVAFSSSSYEVRQIPRGGSGGGARHHNIGKPSWKSLDRKTVEALIGQPV
jgi:hypothetical protein